jgi:prophage regulatory protein
MRVISYGDLRAKGVRWTREYLRKLVAANRFPAPIRLGENTIVWSESEIDQWLEACAAKRQCEPVVEREGHKQ